MPKGFAQGFSVFSDTAELLYKTTNNYAPARERSILRNANDRRHAHPVGKGSVRRQNCSKTPTLSNKASRYKQAR